MAQTIAIARPAGAGVTAFGVLLALYFGILTLVSGWSFTLSQFSEFWFYIVPLAAGLGLRVGLFLMRRVVVCRAKEAGASIDASGPTSTAASISC